MPADGSCAAGKGQNIQGSFGCSLASPTVLGCALPSGARRSHADHSRLCSRPLARRPGARRHTGSGLGRDLLSAGPDPAVDRRGPRLVDHLRDERILARAAGGRPRLAADRTPDRSPWRSPDHAGGLAARGTRAGRTCLRGASGELSCGLGAARRCDRGVALRSRLRDARPHLWRSSAPADHRAHARRRLCFDRQLAGEPRADRSHGLARDLSGLCGAARARRGTLARLRIAASAR